MTAMALTAKKTGSTNEKLKHFTRFPEDLVIRETVPGHDTAKELEDIKKSGAVFDVNYLNEYGHTVLGMAAFVGSMRCCKTLIELGADVSQRDEDGWTALHYAVARGYLDIAKLLIMSGASIYDNNDDGDTPIDFVEDREMRQILLQYMYVFNRLF